MSHATDPVAALPPWEAAPYFQAPTERVVTTPMGGVAQLCTADPMRIGLILAAVHGSEGSVSTNPGVTQNSGINLRDTIAPLQILFSQTGPLCQMAWYAAGSIQCSITVIEISLAKWPRTARKVEVISDADVTKPTKHHGRR